MQYHKAQMKKTEEEGEKEEKEEKKIQVHVGLLTGCLFNPSHQ